MNWDRIEGSWKQLTGRAKAQWGDLTDDDLAVVAGRREQLTGKLQERYGMAKDVAEQQIAEWQRKATDAWFTPTAPAATLPSDAADRTAAQRHRP